MAEKTLAACRVSGPSPSEKEILEAIGETQIAMKDTKEGVASLEASLEALKQLVFAPPTTSASSTPHPALPPVHMPAATHTVPPPPQHAPNLLNLSHGHAGGGGVWGQPTAAVMLGNPQQIFRALAGHGDGN